MHFSFDNILAVWAIAQTVITTLRAGSRVVYLLREGQIGVIDGPTIVPESPLFEVANLFRQCVALDLQPSTVASLGLNHSNIEYRVHNVPLSPDYSSSYSLSPFGNRVTNREASVTTDRSASNADRHDHEEESIQLDAEIENIIKEAEEAHASRSYWNSLLRVVREGWYGPLTLAPLSVPTRRVLVGAAASAKIIAKKCSSLWKARRNPGIVGNVEDSQLRDEEEEEEEWLFGSEDDSDFAVALTTQVMMPSLVKDESHVDSERNKSGQRRAILTAMAPRCFASLRRCFGISEEAYVKSMLQTGPYISFQSNSKGAARAGLFFFFTQDGGYLVKTIKPDEVDALQRMLPKYYSFMQRFGKSSLLTRVCGMYQVALTDSDNDRGSSGTSKVLTFVVMNSVFPAEANLLLTERFDLKGSTIGRECSQEERERKGSAAVLKDLDLQREVRVIKALPPKHGGYWCKGGSSKRSHVEHSYGLHLGATAKAALLKQLRRDVKLLVACDAIDYSLLVGVAKEEIGLDAAVSHAIDTSLQWEARLQGRRHQRLDLLSPMLQPLQAMLAPPGFLLKQSLRIARKVLMWPEPYYGSGVCVVDAGPLSIMQGTRLGAPATYYFGLIDFLQPYNTKKAIEYRLKGLVYPRDSFSCIPPQLYADRFLDYLNEHIT